MKIALSPYLSRELSDFDQIWHADGNFHSEDGYLTKIEIFQIQEQIQEQLRYLKKIPRQWFRLLYADVHLYKKFCASRYLALTASVKIRIGSPKTARNEQDVRTNSHTGIKFSKIFLSSYIEDGLQLYTYISVFLCGVRWRHKRAPNLEPRFWSISYQFEER